MSEMLGSLMGGGKPKMPGGAEMDAKGLAEMMESMKEVNKDPDMKR